MRAIQSFLVAATAIGLASTIPIPSTATDAGELRFAPDTPRPGDAITVTYRPTAALSKRSQVVLRARIRTQHSNRANEPPLTEGTDVETIAALRRRTDGSFAGTFQFPDSALHVSFAVEDASATFVDSNLGRFWELMAHDAAGRPSLAALEQRLNDLAGRNWEEALLTSRRMLALYPDRANALHASWSYERSLAATDKADSIRRVYATGLLALVGRLAGDSAALRRELPSIADMAYWLRVSSKTAADSALLEPWITRAIREQPVSPALIELQWGETYLRSRRDFNFTRALAEFEALWQRAGESLYVAFRGAQPRHQFSRGGWRLAMQAHDTAAYLRWMGRVADGGRYARLRSALQLVEIPGTRREGMRWIREELRAVEAMRPAHRFLGETIEQQRARAQEESRLLMAALGKALVAQGARSAGLDTLTRAAAGSWDLETFQLVADGRASAGDTAGMLAMQARIAADPRTPAALLSSLAPIAERTIGRERWNSSIADGRLELTRRVLARTIEVTPRVPIRLSDSTGQQHSLGELADGRLTFVVYWSKDCGDAMAELAKADSVASRAAQMGLRVLSVTMDEPSPKIDAIVRAKRLTNPVYYDPSKTVHYGLDQFSTPSYLLIDATGKLRFQAHAAPDLVLPYAAALQQERGTAKTSSSRRR